jgi:hypothetical protein
MIIGVDALNKAIKSIAARGKKLDDDIQLAGLSALNHLDLHGDIGPINRLHLALSRGARKAAMIEWASKYGKLSVNVGKDAKEVPFLYHKEGTTNLAGGHAEPWFDCKPDDEVPVAFSLKQLIAMAIKKEEKEQAAIAERVAANPDYVLELDADHAETLAALIALRDKAAAPVLTVVPVDPLDEVLAA